MNVKSDDRTDMREAKILVKTCLKCYIASSAKKAPFSLRGERQEILLKLQMNMSARFCDAAVFQGSSTNLGLTIQYNTTQ